MIPISAQNSAMLIARRRDLSVLYLVFVRMAAPRFLSPDSCDFRGRGEAGAQKLDSVSRASRCEHDYVSHIDNAADRIYYARKSASAKLKQLTRNETLALVNRDRIKLGTFNRALIMSHVVQHNCCESWLNHGDLPTHLPHYLINWLILLLRTLP